MSSYDETMEPSWGEDPISLDNVVDICEQILWELHETNWHCELRALDAHLLDMSKWGSLHWWEREAQVAKVWDRRATRSCLTVAPCWSEDNVAFHGVRAPAPRWKWSRSRLSAFLAVVQQWPDVPEDLRIDVDTLLICEADEYNRLQDSIICLYMQMFVHQFHHLPIAPIRFA
ncbi:hypothetical protein SCP_0501940 [Sparassis crispa]|uniref:Uncharacterized protein n=1 Tax=Sparassis crispa TaxID=139825 RepID=A0A401GLS8_9APHY|nr:hypothetical protein SCP_0501940 [Sparassis crispa]GBE83147.1 hypothetical protein SCP_0501940 [Sparassis crispa]